MGMKFPDPMNPLQYQNVDPCEKLKELNKELQNVDANGLLPVQKLMVEAADAHLSPRRGGFSKTLLVFVPPTKKQSDFQMLSKLLTTLQSLGFEATDTFGTERNTVGTVYVVKNSGADAMCKQNLVNAIMQINRVLTGNDMMSSVAASTIGMLENVVKNPTLMALMNSNDFGSLFM